MKKRKRYHYILWSLVFLILCFVYTAVSIRIYSKEYFETKSDVAIVLGAGTSNGKLSKVFEERVLHSIYLLNSGKVEELIFTGGYGKGQSVSDAYAAKTYAMKKGVPNDKILIEEQSVITYYNIMNAKEIMIHNDLRNALIVSDPYHMKRSMHMCKEIGIDALPSPTPTTMYRSRNTKFDFLVKETMNYWGYLLVGQYRD